MALRFHIENETNLPDGGPVSFTVTGKRIVDIGRDRHLDWTLPDPARLISGKHCEVHYRDGGYWLHDVSTNGTFLNGADQRMRGPHRLRSGDRFVVVEREIAFPPELRRWSSGYSSSVPSSSSSSGSSANTSVPLSHAQ